MSLIRFPDSLENKVRRSQARLRTYVSFGLTEDLYQTFKYKRKTLSLPDLLSVGFSGLSSRQFAVLEARRIAETLDHG